MRNQVLSFEQLDSKKMLSLNMWGLDKIHANMVWNITKGNKDIVVAVIDSGLDVKHSLFKNNLWVNTKEIPGNGIDDEGNGYIDDVNGWNFANNNDDIQDRYGHGTHVAGIVIQVAPGISIMPVKFINDKGMGYTSGALDAIKYVNTMKEQFNVNIVAINASWNTFANYSILMNNALSQLNKNNIMFVAAAGNSAQNVANRVYDGLNIINVSALDMNGSLAEYSNYGKPGVHIAAPGSVIYSSLPYNSYGYLSGTSMAAPFVTGTVALMKSVNPNLITSEIKHNLISSVGKNECLDTNNAVRISKGLDIMKYNQSPSIIKVNLLKIYGVINSDNPVRIDVFINGRIVKRFEAMGEFNEQLYRRMYRRGWNNVKVYQDGKLVVTQRIFRVV